MSNQKKSRIKALGEVALRVNDLESMRHFYEDFIGLELMRNLDHAVVFRIAEGYAGHIQILFLFDRSLDRPGLRVSSEQTTLDHLAFTIAKADFEHEKKRLEAHGLRVKVTTHPWVKWRSMYVDDPEGNRVELVCYDEDIAG